MYKQVSRTNRPQQGQLPVTAKGDKVQITPAVIALQLLGHSQIQSPTCNSWHLAHGNSANSHQWKVPVPMEWWAYTRQGTLIVSKMQKSADLDSHVIVSDLPDKKSYDEDKFKRSLIENYISGKEIVRESLITIPRNPQKSIVFWKNEKLVWVTTKATVSFFLQSPIQNAFWWLVKFPTIGYLLILSVTAPTSPILI